MDYASRLTSFGFVRIPGGTVELGTTSPLPCRLEGYRLNETPVRRQFVPLFWISRFCVTNEQFESFCPKHRRAGSGPDPRHPVTDVTYLDAFAYAKWLSEREGIPFALPTEAEWVFAAAPSGYAFPWGNEPDPKRVHTFAPDRFGPLHADDPRYGSNHYGLLHMSGNVQEYTLDIYPISGTLGAQTNGTYVIVKGGDWSHCPHSAGVQRRGIADVSSRMPTLGFRLVAHPEDLHNR